MLMYVVFLCILDGKLNTHFSAFSFIPTLYTLRQVRVTGQHACGTYSEDPVSACSLGIRALFRLWR